MIGEVTLPLSVMRESIRWISLVRISSSKIVCSSGFSARFWRARHATGVFGGHVPLQDREHRRLAGQEQREDLVGELAGALEDDLIADVWEAGTQPRGDALGAGDLLEHDAIMARPMRLQKLHV